MSGRVVVNIAQVRESARVIMATSRDGQAALAAMHAMNLCDAVRPLLEELRLIDDSAMAREEHRTRLRRDQRALLDQLLASEPGERGGATT